MMEDFLVERILQMDGVDKFCMDKANQELVHVPDIISQYGLKKSWSHTVINSKSNSSTLICQMPGQGNREHYHPEWDEWWYIVVGQWEWLVEGTARVIKAGDIVYIERNRMHRITAIGNSAAIRLAVSRYDVVHVYDDDAYGG
jgi:quercetin dioxygenase-like cupin family protein